MITNDDKLELAYILGNSYIVDGGCLNFDGSLTGGGYGYLPRYGIHGLYYTRYAHRMVLSLVLGRKLNGRLECALHRCDNRQCVNPDHIFLGSYSDNALDREQKGRGHNLKGENCPWKGVPLSMEHRAKLSESAKKRDKEGKRRKDSRGRYAS